MQPHHQATLERFVSACRADDRITAAFLGGSYARGSADDYSDLDLYLITTDEGFSDFVSQRGAFVRSLGEPLFLEDFELPDILFFILADGTEGELGFGHESRFEHLHSGPYTVLLDKKGILRRVVFPDRIPDASKQQEKLLGLVTLFWHELSHFITAMGRGQLWWAQGQLEALRRYCVNLARLRNNYLDADVDVEGEVYFKLEKALPVEQISALQTTFSSMDWKEMLESGLVLTRFFRELAVPLAEAHGLSYPESLERILLDRLEKLRQGI